MKLVSSKIYTHRLRRLSSKARKNLLISKIHGWKTDLRHFTVRYNYPKSKLYGGNHSYNKFQKSVGSCHLLDLDLNLFLRFKWGGSVCWGIVDEYIQLKTNILNVMKTVHVLIALFFTKDTIWSFCEFFFFLLKIQYERFASLTFGEFHFFIFRCDK